MYRSSKAEVRKAIVAKILGLQLPLGGNTFPRVEIADAYESEVIDKGYDVREVSINIESISNTSYTEVVTLSNGISTALCGCDTIVMDDFRSIDITLVQSNDFSESGEADELIHRIRDNYRIIVTIK